MKYYSCNKLKQRFYTYVSPKNKKARKHNGYRLFQCPQGDSNPCCRRERPES